MADTPEPGTREAQSDTIPCPYCGTDCEIPQEDIGVGKIQIGPCGCGNCGASQISPDVMFNVKARGTKHAFTARELATEWYAPHTGIDPDRAREDQEERRRLAREDRDDD